MANYYADKCGLLSDLFGVPVAVQGDDAVRVGDRSLPVIDDVIIAVASGDYPPRVRTRLGVAAPAAVADAVTEVRLSFSDEWQRYGEILPEYEREFALYFDLLAGVSLRDKRVADLGCGSGRWSVQLQALCRELVLVDFSDAIFVARRNLRAADNCVFIMADVTKLPFRPDCCDLIVSLGVLHHLAMDCLDAVRALRRFAPELLIFLYYALDNRPWHYRVLLRGVTRLRRICCAVRSPAARTLLTAAGTYGLYLPLIACGKMLAVLGCGSMVPLYDFYRDKSVRRIRQDVYDRFFTRLEQRVTREQIHGLRDVYREVEISPQLPYWHFLCRR